MHQALIALLLIFALAGCIGYGVVNIKFKHQSFGIKLLSFGVVFWVAVFIQGVAYALVIYPLMR